MRLWYVRVPTVRPNCSKNSMSSVKNKMEDHAKSSLSFTISRGTTVCSFCNTATTDREVKDQITLGTKILSFKLLKAGCKKFRKEFN